MWMACRRARGTATRLTDLVAFGGRVAGPRNVPAARPLASASLARARELLAPTPFDVPVGATVRVSAPRAWTGAACPTDVDVRVGDAYETVTVRASWTNPEGDADASPPTVTATRTESGDVAVVARGGAGGRARVACRIPPRFCGVDVASGGGDVHVTSVVEATVRVSSDGGAVTLGSVKGAAARVDTRGGALSAKNLTADAAVDTAGGAVNIHKLVGRRVRVRSLGGVVVDAAYVAVLDVDTAGGALELGEARVGEAVEREGARRRVRGPGVRWRRRRAVPRRHLRRRVRLGAPRGGRRLSARAHARRRRRAGRARGLRRGPARERARRRRGSLGARAIEMFLRGDSVRVLSTTVRQPVRDVARGRRPRVDRDHAHGGRDAGRRRAQVAAAALACRVVVDARVGGGDGEGESDSFLATPDETDAFSFAYDGFDPFADDEKDVLGAVLDAAQDAVSADDDDRQARPSGEVVVETRSWIASLGLGK